MSEQPTVVIYKPINQTFIDYLNAAGLTNFQLRTRPKYKSLHDLDNGVSLVVSGTMEPRLSAQRFRILLDQLLTHHDWHEFRLHESNNRGLHWDNIIGHELYIQHEEDDHLVEIGDETEPFAVLFRNEDNKKVERGDKWGRKMVLRTAQPLFGHGSFEKGIPFHWYLLAVIITLFMIYLIHEWRKERETPSGRDHHHQTSLAPQPPSNSSSSLQQTVRPLLAADAGIGNH